MRHSTHLCRALLPAVLFLVAGVLSGHATEVPYLGSRVNDNAGLLTSETSAALEAMLKAHEDSTSDQVVVLTVSTLEGEEIEPFAIKVAETWKTRSEGKGQRRSPSLCRRMSESAYRSRSGVWRESDRSDLRQDHQT